MTVELFHQLKYQYIATACANIMTFCHGYGLSWYSAALLKLEKAATPLADGPLITEEEIWLGALYPIGAVFGILLYGLVATYFGERISILYMAVPNFIYWLCVIFCRNYMCLLAGRFIGGLTSGGMYLCVPLFVTEIADRRIRGALGCFLTTIMSFGTLCAFICGSLLDYSDTAYVVICLPIISFVLMYFTPDTPYFLVKNNRIEDAKKSLIYYNSGNNAKLYDYNATEELIMLERFVIYSENKKKDLNIRKTYFNWTTISKILIGIALAALNTLTGIYIFNTSAGAIFEKSGSTIDPNQSSIIFGVLQVVCCYISLVLLDRVGRKILLLLSSCGSTMFLMFIGIYALLYSHGYAMQELEWIPVTCASFFIAFASFGLRPMCFVYIAESLPHNIRDIGFAISMIFINLFPIMCMCLLPPMLENYGVHVAMWISAGFCILGIFISIFVMEETKGKDLNKIEDE